jgi:hypothetical protein
MVSSTEYMRDIISSKCSAARPVIDKTPVSSISYTAKRRKVARSDSLSSLSSLSTLPPSLPPSPGRPDNTRQLEFSWSNMPSEGRRDAPLLGVHFSLWCPTRACILEIASRLQRLVERNRAAMKIPISKRELRDMSRLPTALAASKNFLVALSAITFAFVPGGHGITWNGRAIGHFHTMFDKVDFPPHERTLLRGFVEEVLAWGENTKGWVARANVHHKGPGILVIAVRRELWSTVIGIDPDVRIAADATRVRESAPARRFRLSHGMQESVDHQLMTQPVTRLFIEKLGDVFQSTPELRDLGTEGLEVEKREWSRLAVKGPNSSGRPAICATVKYEVQDTLWAQVYQELDAPQVRAWIASGAYSPVAQALPA